MTPERAKQLAEENGCVFFGPILDGYIIHRKGRKDIAEEIDAGVLIWIDEPDFIAYYLPDVRD